MRDRPSIFRIVGLAALFSAIGGFALWDYARVQRDFEDLKALLQSARYLAIAKDRMIVVRFSGDVVTVADGRSDEQLGVLAFPTLDQVNYDTTVGDDTIVFDGHGTGAWNKREHGGDLRLRSFVGFRRNIAVNCTGLVTEGVYPGE